VPDISLTAQDFKQQMPIKTVKLRARWLRETYVEERESTN